MILFGSRKALALALSRVRILALGQRAWGLGFSGCGHGVKGSGLGATGPEPQTPKPPKPLNPLNPKPFIKRYYRVEACQA